MKNKGLGRGFDSVFNDNLLETAGQGTSVLRIADIEPRKNQPRKVFDDAALSELAASIAQHGLIQPVVVRDDHTGFYSIIAGERRWRASKMAGLTEIPVVILDVDEAHAAELALIENIQREDLNPIEEASAIRFLMQQHDMTQEEVSTRIGKSRPAVANALRLLQLPAAVVDLVREGTISAGHGRAIAGVSDRAMQEKLADETVRLGYSVRALESRIKNLGEAKPEKKAGKDACGKLSADLKAVETALREKLGTKVKIAGNEQKGKLVIEYFSKDDLSNIYDCIIGE